MLHYFMRLIKIIGVVVFLLLTLVMAVVLMNNKVIFLGKATGGGGGEVVGENSYLFASPLRAKADGLEKIRLTVFLLDGSGMGVSKKTVEMNRDQRLMVEEIQKVTDDTGKAVFDISTGISGQYNLSVKLEGKEMAQKVRVVFD